MPDDVGIVNVDDLRWVMLEHHIWAKRYHHAWEHMEQRWESRVRDELLSINRQMKGFDE